VSTSYTVKVNNSFDFEIDATAVSELDVIQNSDSEFHILKDNKSFNATIVDADFNQKKYTVNINNTSYTVDIANNLDLLIKEMGFSLGSTKKVNAIKAPMPGLILEINVKIGDEVREGDTLVILEAMKMENSIASPRDGRIKSISVQKTEAVEKNQLLVEFE
jgi:biotin carboxyl carrier protein